MIPVFVILTGIVLLVVRLPEIPVPNGTSHICQSTEIEKALLAAEAGSQGTFGLLTQRR